MLAGIFLLSASLAISSCIIVAFFMLRVELQTIYRSLYLNGPLDYLTCLRCTNNFLLGAINFEELAHDLWHACQVEAFNS